MRNLYRRHRRFYEAHHRAFNALVQSSAADLQKERTVALYKALRDSNAWNAGVRLLGSVHDSTLMKVPNALADDNRFIRDTIAVMESPRVELLVPIRCSYGYSSDNWAACDDNDSVLHYCNRITDKPA